VPHDGALQLVDLAVALRLCGQSPTQLYWDYLSLGGDLSAADLEAFAGRVHRLPARDRALLGHAISELFMSQGQPWRVEPPPDPLGDGKCTHAAWPSRGAHRESR